MKSFKYILILFFIIGNSYGQVGIGTTSPDASSALDISSSSTGILIPRMLVAERIAIIAPAEGLLVYQTDDVEGFYYYDGLQWINLLSPKSQVGVVPIGSIIAWHGSLTGVGTLPDGWVLCAGGNVSDSESPLNGRLIPNLNSSTTSSSGDNTNGRFLRGNLSSGTYQSEQTNNLFRITGSAPTETSTNITLDPDGTIDYIQTDKYNGTSSTFGGFSSDRYGFQLRGIETRVTNMTVIWIMRIK